MPVAFLQLKCFKMMQPPLVPAGLGGEEGKSREDSPLLGSQLLRPKSPRLLSLSTKLRMPSSGGGPRSHQRSGRGGSRGIMDAKTYRPFCIVSL